MPKKLFMNGLQQGEETGSISNNMETWNFGSYEIWQLTGGQCMNKNDFFLAISDQTL